MNWANARHSDINGPPLPFMISYFQTALKLIPAGKRRGMYLLFAGGAVLSVVDALILLCVPGLFTLNDGYVTMLGMQLKIWVALFVLGIVLIAKNLVFIGFQYVKNLYLSGLQTYFSRQVLASNLLAGKGRGKDIGGSIAGIVSEPLQLILNVYGPLINLVVEGAVGIFIFAALLWLNPVGSALLGLTIVPIIVGYQRMVKVKNQRWGEVRFGADATRSEWGRAALAGAEEIAVMGKADFVFEKFTKVTEVSVRMVANKSTTTDIAKNIVELSVLLSVSVAVGFLFFVMDYGTEELMVMLATFGFSAYRLMPSLNRIMVSLQSIRYGYGALLKIKPDLEYKADPAPLHAPVKAETFTFKTQRMGVAGHAIKNVACTLKTGDVLLIKGESGVGKSTLVRAMMYGAPGLTLTVNGQKLADGLCPARVSVAYMGQSSSIMPVTLRENIAMSDEVLQPLTQTMMDDLKILPLETLGVLEHEKLSGGQRSRIALLRGVEHDASIFFLDEPTAALDSSLKGKVASVIRTLTERAIIVIISHDNHFDKIANQIIEIEKDEKPL
ncbi:MAG: ABC transporter ATP-binding protein [Alphaproteobacteria bacterium]|nr:MAG: ABC transporter ATP-binding protein [Alphaproteobacteria bacterium]